MSLKKRIEKIEQALPDKKISSEAYIMKYLFDSTPEEQKKMKRPKLTIELLREILTEDTTEENMEKAINAMTIEEAEAELKWMEEEEKAAGL